jgi:rubrerythrin
MPWCPTCESEYRDAVQRCPTCDVTLVAAPPEPPDEIDDDALMESGEELAVLARAGFETCLEMRADLKEQRIPCALVREAAEPGAAHGRHDAVDLLVPVSRFEDATRALERKWESLLEKEGLATAGAAAGEGELRCPACGHVLAEDATECPDCGLGLGST